MITLRDIEYVERIAPVAQLLELLGDKFLFEGEEKAGTLVRDQNVLEYSARGLWEVFYYLRARLEDEVGQTAPEERPREYFEELETGARDAWTRAGRIY